MDFYFIFDTLVSGYCTSLLDNTGLSGLDGFF